MWRLIAIFFAIYINETFAQVKYDCVTNYGENGRCSTLRFCQKAKEFGARGTEPTLCGLTAGDYKTAVVCCTDVNQYLSPTKLNIDFSGKRIAQKKCIEYSAERDRLQILDGYKYSSYSCENGTCYSIFGIVGGIRAVEDEFPHMALIGWDRVDGTGFDWNCGGSVISENFILTAAHCVYVESTEFKSSEPEMVRVGGTIPIEIRISSIISHPNYTGLRKYDDIALLRLAQPIEFTLRIIPACLSMEHTTSGKATVIGWGHTSSGGSKADALYKVELEIYEENICKQAYPISRNIPNGITIKQFCAGSLDGGKDACQGDSGGPMQITNKENLYMFDVIGITSFGAGCGSKRGGVYTRISQYIDWIEQTVWPNERLF